MRLERYCGFFFFLLIFLWGVGNFSYYLINVSAPNAEIALKAIRDNKDAEPQHNNGGMYADVLEKIKTCSVNIEPTTNDKFYSCPNGEKITQINWTRGQGERKGVVTRFYNQKGDLRLIYGHPDDK